MSENLQFSVKREKHFLVAVNCESEEFFYGGRGGGLFFENWNFRGGYFFVHIFLQGVQISILR